MHSTKERIENFQGVLFPPWSGSLGAVGQDYHTVVAHKRVPRCGIDTDIGRDASKDNRFGPIGS